MKNIKLLFTLIILTLTASIGLSQSITTLFAWNNFGNPGGAAYFDVTVGPSNITINALDVNTSLGGAITLQVYTRDGTAFGNETNMGAWMLTATGTGTGAGLNQPSNMLLDVPFTLLANTTYGFALVLDPGHEHRYTNGTGANQNYSNADVSLTLGTTSNFPFLAPLFNPRVWNGTIYYTLGGGGGGDDHCAENDCVTVVCPDDVTVDCIENYEADAANALATFNCTSESGGNEVTFDYTGGMQNWVVPGGVTQVTIDAFGAQGNTNAGGNIDGGLGGHASGILQVSPGDVLYIFVGGGGEQSTTGGFNGGGDAGPQPCAIAQGGGGGGATDIRLNATDVSARVLVGGGGGGAGGNRAPGCGRGSGGGGGGGYYGGGGGAGWPANSTVLPGGGTQTLGGNGGTSTYTGNNNNGFPGGLGFGGNGGSEISSGQGTPANPAQPGGFGGGLVGGDGLYNSANNWSGQSGAGGSGYIGGVTNGEMEDGIGMGNGSVVISGFGGGGGGSPAMELFRYVDQPRAIGAANCPGTVYEIVYHVGDNLGNVGCCTQLVEIANAPPVVTVPAGETVSCYEDIPVVTGPVTSDDGTATGDAIVTTSCGGPFDLKILPPVVEGVHECPGTTYTYGYRVRDNCGREVIADRVFTIGNNAPPTIVAPPDMTISCAWNAELNPDYAAVTTGCTLGYTTTVTGPTTSGTDNCPGATYTYTYTVTDDCGRTASDVRKFTIANSAPTFLNCPTIPLQLNCEDDGWQNVVQAWLASIKAESSCGTALNVTNNYNPNSQGLCINNGTKIVRFFATDNCGRTSMCEGMLIIADTEPPLFVEAPQDELVVCNYITQDKLDAWVDAHGNAQVEDCWSNITWTTSPNNPTINCGGNPSPTSVTVTFVARDGCGNKSSMDATFTALPAQGGFGGSTEASAADHLQLFQNQPNPFSDATTISFYMPQGGKATLSIFDISGKLLKEINGDYDQGMNVEEISSSDLQPGMLYYQLSTADETATKRMILLD